MNSTDTDQQRSFKPRGAIAFFLVMICFYITLWMVFYFIMIGRR